VISSIEQPSDWAEALNANPNPETDWCAQGLVLREAEIQSIRPRCTLTGHLPHDSTGEMQAEGSAV
jgi:hypothetical protein